MEIAKYAKIFNTAAKLGAVPFGLNGKRLRMSTCKKQRLKWICYVSFCATYVSFLALNCIALSREKYKGHRFHFLVVLITFLVVLVPSVYQRIFVFKAQEAVFMVNAYLIYTEWFKGKGGTTTLFRLSYVHKVIRTTSFLLKFATVTFVSLFFYDPSLPIHISSAVKVSLGFRIPFNLLYGLLLTWFVLSTVYCLVILIIFALAIPLSIVRVQNEIDLSRKSYSTTRSVRQISGLVLNFRCLQFLNSLFERICGTTFMPIQVIISRLLNICTYLMVRNSEDLKAPGILFILSVVLATLIVWSSFLYNCACVNTSSKRAVKSWRTLQGVSNVKVIWGQKKEQIRYFNKFRKSCKAIGIRFGNFYFITPFKIIGWVSAVTRGSVRMLLTFK